MDAVGLVPPPAPSPRPTAILSRPDHEEGDDDAPAWTSFPSHANAEKTESSFLPTENNDDEEDEDQDEEQEESGIGGDDATQRISGLKSDVEDKDATISLRRVDIPAALAAANGAAKAEKENVAAPAEESVKEEKAEDAKAGGDEVPTSS